MATHDNKETPSGIPAALGAYGIWGFLPLYLLLVKAVPPFEFVGWRIIWTLPICLGIVLLRGQWANVREAIAERRTIAILCITASIIGGNWLLYVWAIQNGNVYAASLGYYINPLINILLGTVLLGERLSRLQWIAVALAACGVAVLLGGALDTLWISLALAISFAVYGLLRKQLEIGSVPGLTIESAVLFFPAMAIAAWYAESPQGSSFAVSTELSLLIVLGGFATAIPLLLFAVAARRMEYSTLGFFQYIAPTLVFIIGLTVFKQELKLVQAASFALIWTAIAVFLWDLWQRSRATAAA